MWKYYKTFTSIFTLLLISAGCTRVDEPTAVTGNQVMTLNLSGYAGTTSDSESTIHSAYVYIFNPGGILENPGNIAVSGSSVIDGAGNLDASWTVPVGKKKVYVITNPPASMESRIPVSGSPDENTVTSLMALHTDFASDLEATKTKGFLMTGVKEINVTNEGSSADMEIEHRHAKIELNIRPSADMSDDAVTVKSVALIRQNWDLTFFGEAAVQQQEDKEVQEVNMPLQNGTEEYTHVCSFYTGPRPVSIDTRPLALDIELDINGVNDHYLVYLNTGATGGGTVNADENPIAIESNHLYRINTTLSQQSISFGITVEDWTDEAVEGNIGGADIGIDSCIVLKPGHENTVSLHSFNGEVTIRLSDKARSLGFAIKDADVTTGDLQIEAGSGLSDIVIQTPQKYFGGEEYYMTVLSGGLRYRLPLRPFIKNSRFEVTGDFGFTYEGGQKGYTVVSVGNYDDESMKIAIPWSAEFSEDGTEWMQDKPEWVTEFTSQGEEEIKEYNTSVSRQTVVYSDPHNEVLQNAAPVTGKNLAANPNGSITTANCYIVNAPGSYTLPVVYGNGIVNGQDNRTAYYGCIDSDFNSMTSAYIADNTHLNLSNPEAVLVWTDAEGLVQNVKLVNNKTISFDIPQDKIRQGNAVIAFKTAGRIRWSWHIWVTDYVPFLLDAEPYDPDVTPKDKRIMNNDNEAFYIMPVNLGWCDGEKSSYARRDIKIRFTQEYTGDTLESDIIQEAIDIYEHGNNPYYQYGRKDPMLPIMLSYDMVTWADKVVYPTGAFTRYNQQADISTAIMNPAAFFAYDGDWCAKEYYTLWNTQHTDAARTTKTVYDPCPPGYCVPPNKVFSGMSLNGERLLGDVALGNKANSPMKTEQEIRNRFGFVFYCKNLSGAGQYDPTWGEFFIPMMGSRYFDTGASDRPNTGFFWTSYSAKEMSGVSKVARNVSAGILVVDPYDNSNRAFGLPVRPMREPGY